MLVFRFRANFFNWEKQKYAPIRRHIQTHSSIHSNTKLQLRTLFRRNIDEFYLCSDQTSENFTRLGTFRFHFSKSGILRNCNFWGFENLRFWESVEGKNWVIFWWMRVMVNTWTSGVKKLDCIKCKRIPLVSNN